MELLSMGDHGIYVWSVYAIGLIFLGAIGTYPHMALRRLKRRRREDKEQR
ncbi:MAG: heme exporter protein CcmD [Gammaproteobacteria bacterium]|nr:heme exporter protein CcmD [Gammaproteobacteria bacterium]